MRKIPLPPEADCGVDGFESDSKQIFSTSLGESRSKVSRGLVSAILLGDPSALFNCCSVFMKAIVFIA